MCQQLMPTDRFNDEQTRRRPLIKDFCFVGSLPPMIVTFIHKGESFIILQKIDQDTVKCESAKRIIHLDVDTIVVHPTFEGKPVDVNQLADCQLHYKVGI